MKIENVKIPKYIYIFILFCESILILSESSMFCCWNCWYFSLESYRFVCVSKMLGRSTTANFVSQISCNTTGHDAVDASQLWRLTENQDRQMCQTYPGCKHRGRTSPDRKIGNPSQSRQASCYTLRKPKWQNFHPSLWKRLMLFAISLGFWSI